MNGFSFLTLLSYLFTILFSLLVLGAMIVVISWPRCKGKGWIVTALAIQLTLPLLTVGLSILSMTFAQQWSQRSSFNYYKLIEIGFLFFRLLELAVPVFLIFGFMRLRGHLKTIVNRTMERQSVRTTGSNQPHQSFNTATNVSPPIGQTNPVQAMGHGTNIYDEPELESPGYTRELVILGFGIAGLIGLFPFAVIAWAMASNDLYKLKSGKEKKDATARTLMTFGYILGIIGSLIGIALIIIVAGYYIDPMRR